MSSKGAELFRVQNSEWAIAEQEDGTFTLSAREAATGDVWQGMIRGLSAKEVAALVAVASEAERYLRAKAR